jgi:hypothetical protein
VVDATAIGMTFPPTSARVEPGRLRFFLETIGETNPVCRDEDAARQAGFAGRPIPPTYLFCLEMIDNDDRFAILDALGVDIARILHGEPRLPDVAVDGDRFAARGPDLHADRVAPAGVEAVDHELRAVASEFQAMLTRILSRRSGFSAPRPSRSGCS